MSEMNSPIGAEFEERTRRLEQVIAAAEADVRRAQVRIDRMRAELAELRSEDWTSLDFLGRRHKRCANGYTAKVTPESDGYRWHAWAPEEMYPVAKDTVSTEAEAKAAAEAAIRKHAEGENNE